jgi:lactoylglutathione lyase
MTLTGRVLHTMLNVTDLDRSLDFYVRLLGMRELRRTEVPEEGRTTVFVGYGEEAATAVVELTWRRGRTSLSHGDAFGHLAIGMPDVTAACAWLRAAGAKVVRDAAPIPGRSLVVAFLEDPDGYLVELVERV